MNIFTKPLNTIFFNVIADILNINILNKYK